MQLIQSKANLIERILHDKEGRLVRATFCVYENAGRIKARLVDFTYINELKGKILTLSGFTKANLIPRSDLGIRFVSSPYFNKETILFSGSKPRAPTIL